MRTLSTHYRGCTLIGAEAGDGPPVLFIHGTGVGGAAWRPQIDVLARHHNCAWFDNRGFGASANGETAQTLELLADDTIAVMNTLGWQRAHLVGHSLGGLIALFAAARAPDRVISLALLNTFATGAVPTRLTWDMLYSGIRTRIGTRPMRRRAFLEMILSQSELARADDALIAKLTELFEHDLAYSPPIVFRQLSAMRRADARPLLSTLRAMPTLVVSAREDRIAPPEASAELAALLPGSQLIVLEDTAHAAPLLRTDDVNAALLAHLASASARNTGKIADAW